MSDELLERRVARYEVFDRANRPYVTWQVAQFIDAVGQRVLEIGCGVGSILAQLGSRELVAGIDVDVEVLDVCRNRFREGHHQFFQIDFEAIPDASWNELAACRFDTVLSINHLEHIRDDAATARRVHDLLSPGGTFVVLTPAHQFLYGHYDQLDGHYRRYSKESLSRVLEKAGFTVESLRYFNMVGALGWFVRYKVLRSRVHGEGDFGVMNALIPIMRPIERLIPPFFGLSVIAIARKKESS
jgi:SAM-dependent methyltransferase